MRIAVCHIAINDAQHLLLQQHGGYGHFSIFCANLHEKRRFHRPPSVFYHKWHHQSSFSLPTIPFLTASSILSKMTLEKA